MKTKMKLLLMVLLMGTTMSLSAQGQKTLTSEDKAKKETEKMTKDLSLTSDQQAKIQAINLKYAKQRDEVMSKQKAEGKMTDAEKQQVKENAQKSVSAQEAEFKSVLTADQYQKYLNNKEAVKEKASKKSACPEKDKAQKSAKK